MIESPPPLTMLLSRHTRRREFILLVGSAVPAWPIAARGQRRSERIRRVGALMAGPSGDPEVQRRGKAFRDELKKLGWIDGQNIQIEDRWPAGDVKETDRLAQELVGLLPDVILAVGTPAAIALQQKTGAIPIVFVAVSDPVAGGLVKSLAQPGGNITGFTNFEFSLGGKWLEILKDTVPNLRRIGIVYFPGTSPFASSYVDSITAAAASLLIEPVPLPAHDANDLDRLLSSLGEERNSALIFLPDIFTVSHRRLVIDLPARYNLPAIYGFSYFAKEGGFICYGVDSLDLYPRAAHYVDQILKGAKPANLPVQQPTKFEFIINLRTAKALGLTVPPSLLARADEVIE
jgi:putative tryptophan/tyrosine transport system substrate-binding protein